jgi:hypothetical protein
MLLTEVKWCDSLSGQICPCDFAVEFDEGCVEDADRFCERHKGNFEMLCSHARHISNVREGCARREGILAVRTRRHVQDAPLFPDEPGPVEHELGGRMWTFPWYTAHVASCCE